MTLNSDGGKNSVHGKVTVVRASPAGMTSRIGRGPVDELVRERVRAWIRYEMDKRQIDSIREASRKLKCSHAYLTRVLNGETTTGLELCLRLRQQWHVSIDAMVDDFPPGYLQKK